MDVAIRLLPDPNDPRVRVRLDDGAEEGGPMVHDLREDERELAGAILEGLKRRTDQAFGDYQRAAYEGIYRLPDTAAGRPAAAALFRLTARLAK